MIRAFQAGWFRPDGPAATNGSLAPPVRPWAAWPAQQSRGRGNPVRIIRGRKGRYARLPGHAGIFTGPLPVSPSPACGTRPARRCDPPVYSVAGARTPRRGAPLDTFGGEITGTAAVVCLAA